MANTAEPLDANYKPVSSVIVPGSGYIVPEGGNVTGTDSVTGQSYAPQAIQMATQNAAVAAGTGTTPVTVKASAGYIHNFVVTTTATAAMSFYDNASAASGTVLYTTSSTIAAGTIIVLDMPFKNGLTLSQASGTAAITIGYI